ncbi:MAG: RNase adapter RapZ [Streptosporangiales bacterium]|nr:RNase adapter RapZ [Streptosporangiales bacterium]
MGGVDAKPGGPPPDIVLVTGMSGAGRSTAANYLEDLDWYVVDNLPPALIGTLADLGARTQGAIARLAVVIDVRSRAFTSDLLESVHELRKRGVLTKVLFLEAADAVLVRRYESVRRPHPLQSGEGIIDGIAKERERLGAVRGEADLVIDTSDLNVHELRHKIVQAFSGPDEPRLRVTVMSFGYKYGLPVDADMVADCRFLPNPHWVPELRALTGQDDQVRDYVLGREGATEFVDTYVELLSIVERGYVNEGKRFSTFAVGCTGGKHRSVAIAEALAHRLAGNGVDVHVHHRDLGRE